MMEFWDNEGKNNNIGKKTNNFHICYLLVVGWIISLTDLYFVRKSERNLQLMEEYHNNVWATPLGLIHAGLIHAGLIFAGLIFAGLIFAILLKVAKISPTKMFQNWAIAKTSPAK